MAFPSVRSSSAEVHVCTSTPTLWTMPASIVAGDLLVACFYRNIDTGTFAVSGWTADSNNVYESRGMLFFRVADGTDTCSVTNSNACAVSGVITAVQGWGGTIATDVDVAVATTNNPALVTAGWGSDDNLFLEFFGGAAGTLPAVSVWSTNYTEIDQATGDYTNDILVGGAYRQLASDSDDPNAITVTGTPTYVSSWTLVVEPAVATTPGAGAYADVDGLGAIRARLIADGNASEDTAPREIVGALNLFLGTSAGDVEGALNEKAATADLGAVAAINSLLGADTAFEVNDGLRQLAELYTP